MGEQQAQIDNILLPKEVIGKDELSEMEKLLD